MQFEFIIPGPPMSLQARNRQRLQAWKRFVRKVAAIQWRKLGRFAPVTHGVAIEIIYFFDTTAPDVDNIIKPIQDALVGLVYVDDRQVTDAISRKRNINSSFRVRGMSRYIADGFVKGDDFVYVKVTRQRNLTRID